MAIDAKTEVLLGRQMEAFRAKYPTAFIGYEFGNGVTKIRIYKDADQKVILVRNTFNGDGDDAVRMHVKSCLVELGIPFLPTSLLNDVTKEMCAGLVRDLVAEELKSARKKHDQVVEKSQTYVKDSVSQANSMVRQAVQIEVRDEIARYDEPKGFWQCFFDRFRKNAPAEPLRALPALDQPRLTYAEWKQVHEAEREVDTRYMPPAVDISRPLDISRPQPRALELDGPQTQTINQTSV